MSEFTWSVQEMPTGLQVASGDAHTLEDAKREAGHYAIQYAQDGPVRYAIKQSKKTIFTVSLNLTTAE